MLLRSQPTPLHSIAVYVESRCIASVFQKDHRPGCVHIVAYQNSYLPFGLLIELRRDGAGTMIIRSEALVR